MTLVTDAPVRDNAPAAGVSLMDGGSQHPDTSPPPPPAAEEMFAQGFFAPNI